MKKYIFLLSGLLLLAMSFTAMDFFSSMTKVDYSDGTKSLKFTTKMNTEHIANAIKINPNTAGFEAEVKKYINHNMDVYVNNIPKPLTFTGSQINGESVWVYYEIGGIDEIKSLKIKNTILLETYPKQNNVLNVAYKGQQKTMSFQRGREVNVIEF